MIQAKNVSFSYSKNRPLVLDDFNLEINEGEILALLGPNGIGKSTAISLLSGLKKPNSGTIEINGKNIGEISASERAKTIGIVAQNPEFDNLSIYDSILLGRLPNFIFAPCKHDHKATKDIIERIGLSKIADQSVSNLSGGERQLVAIARALVSTPKFLLLDEPTSNLDMANKIAILKLIKKAAKEDKVSILISLHDLNEAFQIANKFAFIKEGKIISCTDINGLNEKLISSVYGVEVSLFKNNGKTNLFIKEEI